MKYGEARAGRIFVLRLEDGEILHEVVEQFARDHAIRAATVIAVGGADEGSRLVVGPAVSRCAPPIAPLIGTLAGVHELAGVGTLFPDDQDAPILHMHLAAGRADRTVTGCVREGVKVWHVCEVVIQELDGPGRRVPDPKTGFKLLDPTG